MGFAAPAPLPQRPAVNQPRGPELSCPPAAMTCEEFTWTVRCGLPLPALPLPLTQPLRIPVSRQH